jgi:hypothetical protein
MLKEARNGQESLLRQGEGRLWVKWVLANAAGILMAGIGAGIVELVLGPEPEVAAETHYFWWIYAGLLGIMQWLVLR